MPHCKLYIRRSLILLLFTFPALQGCDFFRTLAGRPDSAFIEAKRQSIEREEAAHRSRVDSVKGLSAMLSDSLALIDSVRVRCNAVVEPRQLDPACKATLDARYYIIVGSFSKASNAAALSSRLKEEGYSPALIKYKNGFTAVGICQSDDLSEVAGRLEEVRGKSFVPDGIWILNNE